MLKRLSVLLLLMLLVIMSTGCSNNYSNGERIGFITKFSEKGIVWKSWEGELNLTQTGMNTSSLFDFSIDNDRPDETLIKTLDSAAINGWKIKVTYHETFGLNWFKNRGETTYFVTAVTVLDKTPMSNMFGKPAPNPSPTPPSTDSPLGSEKNPIHVVVDK